MNLTAAASNFPSTGFPVKKPSLCKDSLHVVQALFLPAFTDILLKYVK
jgi:hypothetical protein